MPELLEAGVHFGHQTKRWNPKMKPFIFEKRNAIYIINLDETVKQLQRATDFLQDVAQRGGKILFVGCKKQAQEAVKEAAVACGQFYVNQRWLGGTLTNLATIRKSIGRLKYIEEIEASPDYKKMGKQELAALESRRRQAPPQSRRHSRHVDKLPDAIIIIDTTREQNAVNEARRLGIPTVAHRRYECRSGDYRLPDRGQRRRHSRDPRHAAEAGRRHRLGERRSAPARGSRDGGRLRLTTPQFAGGSLMAIAIRILLAIFQSTVIRS